MAGAGGAGCAQDHARGFRNSDIRTRGRARVGSHSKHATAVERLPMPAAWWCGTCSYLLPPSAREQGDPTRGDPMRRVSDPQDLDLPCPHCGERAWIDLGVVPIAMRARDEEVEEARIARTRGSAATVAIFVTAMVALVAVTVAPVSSPWAALPILAFTAVAIVLARLASKVRGMARRWHRPARRWTKGRRLARGTAKGQPWVAPLSARKAIAWVVAVRYAGKDPRRGLRATTSADWALVEQRCGELEIDGTRFTAGLVVDVELRELEGECPDADAWLRTRGLDPQDDLQLFEGIITDDDVVEVYANEDGPVPICRSTFS